MSGIQFETVPRGPKFGLETAKPAHQNLPIFAIPATLPPMSTMNISLPDELKLFVDQQVGSRGYTSSSEYVRELIRREQDRAKLRGMLLEGASSPLSPVVADKAYFDGLRARVHDWSQAAAARSAGATGSRARASKKSRVR